MALDDAPRLSIKEITDRFAERHGDDYERKVTTKWIGGIVRKRLGLRPQKSHGTFVIPTDEMPKLKRLYEKYGLSDRQDGVDQETSGFPREPATNPPAAASMRQGP